MITTIGKALVRTLLLGIALGAAGAQAGIIDITLEGEGFHKRSGNDFYTMTFSNIPRSIGSAILEFHARGDYDGEECYCDEQIFWAIDPPSLSAIDAWDYWGRAGTVDGTVIQYYGLNDVEWTQRFVIPANEMVKATRDGTLDFVVFMDLADNYFQTDFSKFRLTYRAAIPEPSVGALLGLCLLLMGATSRARRAVSLRLA